MLEKINFDSCQRPTYTNYELSKMVSEKRRILNISIDAFAEKHGVPTHVVEMIETCQRSFNVPIFKACAKILGITLEQITSMDSENMGCISFRAEEIKEDTLSTVNLANEIFNEMVMQYKISAR